MIKIAKRESWLVFLFIMIAAAPVAFAQQHEISVLVGRMKTGDRGLRSLTPVKTAFDGAVTYQINYGQRMVDGKVASFHWELAITGTPNTNVKSTNLFLPKSYSSLFFTPGVKLKIFPGGISPYLVAGGGLARYKESSTNISGAANTGDRANTTWVFDYGGGVDFSLIKYLALRGEIRDFITGNPQFSTPFLTDKQHNVFVAGGVVIRW